MRLTEITKGEFVDKLKDSPKEGIRKKFFPFKASINELGWNAELRDRTNDSVIINAYRFEKQYGVAQIRYKAYSYFIDNEDLLMKYGVSEIDKQETPDQFMLVLGW